MFIFKVYSLDNIEQKVKSGKRNVYMKYFYIQKKYINIYIYTIYIQYIYLI